MDWNESWPQARVRPLCRESGETQGQPCVLPVDPSRQKMNRRTLENDVVDRQSGHTQQLDFKIGNTITIDVCLQNTCLET